MRIQSIALVVLIALLTNESAWSQEDPFGGPSNDPFGGTPQKAVQQKAADPFGGSEADPFGGSIPKNAKTIEDPFGGTPQQVAQKTSRAAVKIAQAKNQQMGMGPEPPQQIRVAHVNQHETEMRIHSALGDETTQTFIHTPLDEAIHTISKTHDIPIVVDARALEEIGLTYEEPVTIDLKNVSLRSFIRLMLRELDLTYIIKDEVMQITTIEAAEQNLGTKMYRLPDDLVANAEKVLKSLQDAVVPGTWSVVGGPSTATTIDHVLIVSTTSDVHNQVENFLNSLIEMYAK